MILERGNLCCHPKQKRSARSPVLVKSFGRAPFVVIAKDHF